MFERAPEAEPLQVDPRKVERLERYLVAYAHVHAVDPLEHLRRVHAGHLFLARLRRRGAPALRLAGGGTRPSVRASRIVGVNRLPKEPCHNEIGAISQASSISDMIHSTIAAGIP